MIFATDLDGTMIYSKRRIAEITNQLTCVEFLNEKPISYMTDSAIEKLKFLLDKIYIIPATTRSTSQFMRVKLFTSTEFAIVANGGIILHNGIIDKAWQESISSLLIDYNFEDVLNVFYNLPNLTSMPSLVDSCFVFAKTDNIVLVKKILESKLDKNKWQLSFQGNKVYAIPCKISKGNALKYICENYINDDSPIIASGDSNLDLSMLDYSDYALIPSDCKLATLHSSNKFIKIGFNISSTEKILDFILDKLNA